MPKRADNNEAHANSFALSEVRMNSPMPENMRAIYRDYPLDVFCDNCWLPLLLSLLSVGNCGF
jgi:hypothetical protein